MLVELVDLFSRVLVYLVKVVSLPFLYLAHPFAKVSEYLASFWTWQLTLEIAVVIWLAQMTCASLEVALTSFLAKNERKTRLQVPSIKLPKGALRPPPRPPDGAGDPVPVTHATPHPLSDGHQAVLHPLSSESASGTASRPSCSFFPAAFAARFVSKGLRTPAREVSGLDDTSATDADEVPFNISDFVDGPRQSRSVKVSLADSTMSLMNESNAAQSSTSISVQNEPLESRVLTDSASSSEDTIAAGEDTISVENHAKPDSMPIVTPDATPCSKKAGSCESINENQTGARSRCSPASKVKSAKARKNVDPNGNSGDAGKMSLTEQEQAEWERYQFGVAGAAQARAQRSARALNVGPTTRTVRMRATEVKLSVYLNTEVDKGYATVISLPSRCNTLPLVLQKIQEAMQLDKRMLYASELFVPDGTRINAYQVLVDYAALDTAIIVGCGEAFDHTSIPYDLLQFHLNGGGREAAKKVKKMLEEQRKEECLEKADHVRASGHGLDSRAAVDSKQHNQQMNRKYVEEQRWEYGEQLMLRAAQHHNLMSSVQRNNITRKMEEEERRQKREDFERARREALAQERELDKELASLRKQAERDKIKEMHDKVKRDFETSNCHSKAQRMANISRFGSTTGGPGAYMC